jgi:hypothetical protein
MWDALFPEERAASLSQSIQRPEMPPPAPGLFTGFGGALVDSLPDAGLEVANAWSGILDAYGKASAYADPEGVTGGMFSPDSFTNHIYTKDENAALEAQTIGQIGNNQMGRQLRAEAKKYQPDPAAVGMAGQIVHGVGVSLAKAGAYAATTGPLAPWLYGTDVGINRADELKDQGVDSGTADMAGLISGTVAFAGMKMPASLGATRLGSAAAGAAVNPAMSVAENLLIHSMLQDAGFDKIAAQYKPLDPLNLTVSALTGAAFGGVFHRAGDAPAPRGRTLTSDEHAAALTMNEARTRDGDTLTNPGDMAAANAAVDAQTQARLLLDAGEPVSVAHMVAAEKQQLDAAYQRVLDSPAGDAMDPVVHITPEDIDGAIIARGGWKGIGDVEVKGQGWGLVKFIWRHGEMSDKPAEFQVTRDDVQAFPEVIRELDPTTHVDDQGGQYREWRVMRPGEDGIARQVVYVDKTMGGHGRRVVSMYVQEPGRPGFDAPLSQRKTDVVPESSGKWSDTHAGDTQPGLLHPTGQDTSASANVAQGGLVSQVADAVSRLFGRDDGAAPEPEPQPRAIPPDDPDQARAYDAAARIPDAVIPIEDATGNPAQARAADLMQQVRDAEQHAQTQAKAFEAAINCALRSPR